MLKLYMVDRVNVIAKYLLKSELQVNDSQRDNKNNYLGNIWKNWFEGIDYLAFKQNIQHHRSSTYCNRMEEAMQDIR